MTNLFDSKCEELNLKSIPVRMTDSDFRYLAEKCGKAGLSIQDLFEVFVGDLIGGSFYSGSDESMLADEWFDRHGFSYLNDNSLLSHILDFGSADTVDDFLTAWNERSYYQDHPEELDPDDYQWWEDDISDILDGYDREISDDDINILNDWLEELKNYENKN